MDIYKEITDRIIAEMEHGQIPWRKPWIASGGCISHATDKTYSMLNQMLLNRPGEYATFKQIQTAGGRVRKGEKSRMVVFWKLIKTKDEDSGEEKEVPYLRHYNVFNLDQCESITPKHTQPMTNTVEPDEAADKIISDYITRSGVRLVHEQGDRAFYRPSTDTVTVPLRQQFNCTSEYYGTTFHELAHSTGHHRRLNRLDKTAFFGSDAYSKEELIAEITASALLHDIGLETSGSFRNNAAYIQSWLQVLQNDKRFIVSAAGKAEKAMQMIKNYC